MRSLLSQSLRGSTMSQLSCSADTGSCMTVMSKSGLIVHPRAFLLRHHQFLDSGLAGSLPTAPSRHTAYPAHSCFHIFPLAVEARLLLLLLCPPLGVLLLSLGLHELAFALRAFHRSAWALHRLQLPWLWRCPAPPPGPCRTCLIGSHT